MNIRFAYPTLAAPTAVVDLVDCELLPRSRPYRRHQTVIDTDGDTQLVYDCSGSIEVIPLQFAPLSDAKAAEVKAFFRQVPPRGVDMRAYSFEMLDSDGERYTVRLNQDVVEAVRKGVAWHEIALALRVM